MDEKIQKIGVTAFITNGNKALIVRRSAKESFLPGYYELPGGKMEFGESPEGALRREAIEEVGLEIEPIKPYSAFAYVSSNGNKHTVDIQYFVKVKSDPNAVKLSDAHDDHRWVLASEIDNFQFTDEMRKVVEKGFNEIL